MNPLFGQLEHAMRREETPLPVIILAMTLGAIFLTLSLGTAIKIFYCLTLSRALNRCAEHNRMMSPGWVWLMLIPGVDVVIQFIVAVQVPASLASEFTERGRDDDSDYGRAVGLTAAVLFAIWTPLACIPLVNICAGVLNTFCLVFWIMFWARIVGYYNKLE